MRRCRIRTGGVVAWLCTASLLAALASAQQLCPLAGQGVPDLETTEVFASVYLDRLLDVNAAAYQWTGALYFGMSWRDPTAAARIAAATARTINSELRTSCVEIQPKVAR